MSVVEHVVISLRYRSHLLSRCPSCALNLETLILARTMIFAVLPLIYGFPSCSLFIARDWTRAKMIDPRNI